MKIFKVIKKRWYILVILVILAVIGYQKFINEPAKKEQAKAHEVKKRNIKEILSLAGKIDADEKVILRFQASGRLAWVGVKEGDYVKKYQTVASLDQRSLKKTLEKYLRDYSKERNDFEEDRRTTYPSGAVTDTIKRILEKNQYDLDKAVLDVELQNLSIEYANLWTPIEGIVTRVDSPFAGVNITPAQAEFEIVNPKTVYYSATVDQTEVVMLKTGMKGKIIFDAYLDDQIDGEIVNISFAPKTGETGTTYDVKIAFNNANDSFKYRLEMTGDVDFVIKERKNIIAIPDNYLKQDKERRYVMKKVNGQSKKTYVKSGEEIDSNVEIIDGLTDGDIIYD